jgi:Ca2+ transporting ATPase
MATVNGRPAQYGITLRQLRDLMEVRGKEGIDKISAEYSGVLNICKNLYSSPTEGNFLAHSGVIFKTR